ncbi:MAG: outer membrane lipoprotein LolB [Granulosicoccus sp.]|nr:outer membrane lipoprotein LolB [Granulosicoccus sp.]
MRVVRARLSSVGAMLLLSVLLGACQSLDDVDNPGEGALSTGGEARYAELVRQRDARLAGLDSFQVEGGLGIWTDQESMSARMTWQQVADHLDLTLTGPLSMGTLRMRHDHGLAVLTRGNRRVASGPSADKVLQRGLSLDAPVPIGQLGSWIRGLPGNATSLERDAQGKLTSLRFIDRQGTRWQANFRRYSPWDDVDLPTLITASGGPYSVRLVLKNWQLAATTVVPETSESNNRLPIPGR